MFLEEIEDLRKPLPGRFRVIYVLDEERQDVEMLSGFLDADRLNGSWRRSCPMRTSTTGFSAAPKFSPTSFMTRRSPRPQSRKCPSGAFRSDAPKRAPRPPVVEGKAAVGSQVEVILDGRATSFTLSPEAEPILDAALKVRGDAPYACKNGVCGTCRAKVVDGKVEMDQNFALEDDEVARGYVLACQAHPVTERVVVDFDQ